MIGIRIIINQTCHAGGKVGGRIEVKSFHEDPVLPEEIRMREAIMESIKQIGIRMGKTEGSRVYMGETTNMDQLDEWIDNLKKGKLKIENFTNRSGKQTRRN